MKNLVYILMDEQIEPSTVKFEIVQQTINPSKERQVWGMKLNWIGKKTCTLL